MDTLINHCRHNIPPEVENVALLEGLDPGKAAEHIITGRLVIPNNTRRKHKVIGIGDICQVKVNVNIGTSNQLCDPVLEMQKAEAALVNGADSLMDLSTGGDLLGMRKELLRLDTVIGTVPVYEAVRRAGNAADLEADLLFRVIREHCNQGVDFLTLHCGVNTDVFQSLHEDPRTMGVVSRGGAFHIAMMASQGIENPLWSEFDYLLEILGEYDVVLSLGDGMRPGCQDDAERLAKSVEYLHLGRLAKRALKAGVQRMIEGPGHIPLEQIGYNVRMIKELTNDAPLYLLGPLITDIAPGYDHLVGAIGGSVACMYGANFLCMVSPSEHLALPRVEDIIEGTRASVIAAHIGDLVQGSRKAKMQELLMGEMRHNLDWEAQFATALFPEVARAIHDRDPGEDTCSMCGDLCAVKMIREIFP